jgi:hypothetical protein
MELFPSAVENTLELLGFFVDHLLHIEVTKAPLCNLTGKVALLHGSTAGRSQPPAATFT